MSDRDQVAALAARLLERGPLDHLVLNAGITSRLETEDPGYEQEVVRVFDVNLHHVRMQCDKLLLAMGAQGGGSVVITASLAALRGNDGIGVYSLAKAALVQLARDAAVRWGLAGVRVNAFSPGLIATGWEDRMLATPELAEQRMRMTPLRRIGRVDEVAAATLFLLSPADSFVTGHNLVVDGDTAITDGG